MVNTYLQSLLGSNEKLLLASRQHWFTLASTILFETVMILIIIVTAVIAANFLPLFVPIIIVAGLIVLIIPLITMTHDILVWANRQYALTNRRVIQISGVFNKSVTDSSLDKINDVKMEQSFFGRLLDYGDIEILTASETGIDILKRISDPVRFKLAMVNAKESLERGEESRFHSDDIPTMIMNLDQLLQRGILTDEEFQKKKGELLSRM